MVRSSQPVTPKTPSAPQPVPAPQSAPVPQPAPAPTSAPPAEYNTKVYQPQPKMTFTPEQNFSFVSPAQVQPVSASDWR